jgi:hypothetical protein
MAGESNIREWLRKVKRDRWLQAKVMNSMGKDWQRFDELMVKITKVELIGSEKEELQSLLAKLKAKNPDDPNIQALEI